MLQLNVASNSNDNLSSNTGIVSGEERGNNGASTANLRQQGSGSTLVLLNGRRTATHGLKGRSVDLNSIPFSAIERVEILRDGASAVYGTDAIGGVINFILKKDFRVHKLAHSLTTPKPVAVTSIALTCLRVRVIFIQTVTT